MSAAALRAARMRSQRLDGRLHDAAELVRTLGGIQAQEPRAGALSIRARAERLTAADIERALVEERSIVRTWALRGTIHFVAAEDMRWLHELLAPLWMPAEQRALDALGVSRADRPRAVAAIRRALAGGPLTRAELCEELERAGISTAGQRAAHLPRLAALEGHVCFGPVHDGKNTYVLVGDWIGSEGAPLARDAALAELARRYLGAYAPAGPEDLAKWSGLGLRDARAAWASIASELTQVEGGWALASAAETLASPPPDPPLVRLLPAFDTYLLGYRDRDLAVPSEHVRAVWPGGGIVRPAIVANGLAVGTWRRTGARIVVEPFGDEVDASAELADVERFLGAQPADA